jgi:hypothetical protein
MRTDELSLTGLLAVGAFVPDVLPVLATAAPLGLVFLLTLWRPQ